MTPSTELGPSLRATQDVAAALEDLAKDVVMAVASVPRILTAPPPAVRTEHAPQAVRSESSTITLTESLHRCYNPKPSRATDSYRSAAQAYAFKQT